MKKIFLGLIGVIILLITNDLFIFYFLPKNEVSLPKFTWAEPAQRGSPPPVTTKSYQTFNHIVYSQVSCSADYDHSCNVSAPVDSVPGYIICSPIISVSGGRGSYYFGFFTSNPFPNDDQSPPRFRTITFGGRAEASHDPFSRWGSNINFSNVGAKLISDFATNADRKAAGCVLS